MTSKQVVAICKRACVHGDMVIVLHQDATKTWEQLETGIAKLSDTCLKDGRPRTIYVLVGPEGGISDAEVEAFTKPAPKCACWEATSYVRPPPVRSRVIARASIGTFRLIPAPLREIAGIAPFPAGVAW